jgi:hypothetical protein
MLAGVGFLYRLAARVPRGRRREAVGLRLSPGEVRQIRQGPYTRVDWSSPGTGPLTAGLGASEGGCWGSGAGITRSCLGLRVGG